MRDEDVVRVRDGDAIVERDAREDRAFALAVAAQGGAVRGRGQLVGERVEVLQAPGLEPAKVDGVAARGRSEGESTEKGERTVGRREGRESREKGRLT